MNNPMKRALTRRGFTILELLIVISIIAIIATLATGAAIKSMKQNREKRIAVMAKGLEVALMNYRAQENKWPFDLNDRFRKNPEESRYWFHGEEENFEAFQKMFGGTTSYLDENAYLVTVKGSRGTLKEALKKGGKSVQASFGYPKPDDTSRFCYFCVCYSPLTDTVKVVRQDEKHINAEGGEFKCPKWKP